MGGDTIIVQERKVNEPALVGIHRLEPDLTMLPLGPGGRRGGKGLELLAAAALVSLDVDDDRVMEAKLAAHQGGDEELEGIEDSSMTTDEDRKVTTVDV